MPIFRENSTTEPQPVDGAIITVRQISFGSASSSSKQRCPRFPIYQPWPQNLLGQLWVWFLFKTNENIQAEKVLSGKGLCWNWKRRGDKILKIGAIKFRLGNSEVPTENTILVMIKFLKGNDKLSDFKCDIDTHYKIACKISKWITTFLFDEQLRE